MSDETRHDGELNLHRNASSHHRMICSIQHLKFAWQLLILESFMLLVS